MQRRKSQPKSTRRAAPPTSDTTAIYVIRGTPQTDELADDLLANFDATPVYVDSRESLERYIATLPLVTNLVILDVSMTDPDGQSLLDQLCRLQPSDPIILLTAVHSDELADPDTVVIKLYAYTPQPMQLGQFEIGYPLL